VCHASRRWFALEEDCDVSSGRYQHDVEAAPGVVHYFWQCEVFTPIIVYGVWAARDIVRVAEPHEGRSGDVSVSSRVASFLRDDPGVQDSQTTGSDPADPLSWIKVVLWRLLWRVLAGCAFRLWGLADYVGVHAGL
jgi:hypothetical protein